MNMQHFSLHLLLSAVLSHFFRMQTTEGQTKGPQMSSVSSSTAASSSLQPLSQQLEFNNSVSSGPTGAADLSIYPGLLEQQQQQMMLAAWIERQQQSVAGGNAVGYDSQQRFDISFRRTIWLIISNN